MEGHGGAAEDADFRAGENCGELFGGNDFGDRPKKKSGARSKLYDGLNHTDHPAGGFGRASSGCVIYG